jgi:hypothetical protein
MSGVKGSLKRWPKDVPNRGKRRGAVGVVVRKSKRLAKIADARESLKD